MPTLTAPTVSSPVSHSQGSSTSPTYAPGAMQNMNSPTTDAAMLSSFAAVSATAVIPPTATTALSPNHIPVVTTTPSSRGGVVPVVTTASTNQYNMTLVSKPRVNALSVGFGSIPNSHATNTSNMGGFGRASAGSTNVTLLANAPASLRTIAFGRPAHVSAFGIAQASSSQSTHSSSHHGSSSPNSPTDYASPLPPHMGTLPNMTTTRSTINGFSGATPRTLLPSNSTHHFTPAAAAAAMVVTPPLASNGMPTPITTPATLPASEQYQEAASIPVMQLVPHSRVGTVQGLGLRTGSLRQARSGVNVRRNDHPSPNGSDQAQEYDGHEELANGPNADDDENVEHEDEPVHDDDETEGHLNGKDEESSQLNKRYALRQQASLTDTTHAQHPQKYYFAPTHAMRRATSCSSIATSGTSSWNNSPTVHAKKVHSPSHLHIPLQNLEVSSRTGASHLASGSAMTSNNHFAPHSLLQLTAPNHHAASLDKRSQRTLCQVELNILTRLYCEGASTAFVARIFDVSERTIQRKYKELTDQKRMLEQQHHLQQQQQHLNQHHHHHHHMQRRQSSSHSLSSMSSDSVYHDTTIAQAPEYTDAGDQINESAFMDNADDASSQASGASGVPNESYGLGLQQRKRGRTRKDYREIDMIMRSLYLQTPHIGGKEVRDILMRDYNISIALTQVYDRKKALREDPAFVAAHNAALHAANQGATSDGNATDGSMDSPPSHLNHLVHAQPEFGPRMRITRSMNNLIEAQAAHAAQLTSDGEHPTKRVAVDTSLHGR